MTTVAVIDYGMGNIRSVAKALEHVGGAARIEVTHEAQRVLRADRVVLPGVGALRDCMAEINRLGLVEAIRECVRSRPFLGICLGLQALFDESEENGGTAGLGLLPGRVLHFGGIVKTLAPGATLKIPHMGWNQVRQLGAHRLWEGVPQDSRFYFVHSYYVEPEDPAIVAGSAEYGAPFAAAVAHGNVFAVQFHPEKSQHEGLRVLANFVNWDGG